jgi:hypothetical protein
MESKPRKFNPGDPVHIVSRETGEWVVNRLVFTERTRRSKVILDFADGGGSVEADLDEVRLGWAQS